ncbi:MAG: DegT/DnrJ/EryC1/StrS family aminotransferase [Myxococcota bacterium]|nr:DegT/DnrJ/EryC1/StrS family aminotransferase [Myxococcota bacterium]
MADLAARHRRHAAEIEAGVLQVLRGGRYIGGERVAQAEAALAAQMGCSGGVGVASGTDALILALSALGVGPGTRVALPALSFFATTEALLWLGATPVFVDLRADRPLMDNAQIPADVDLVLTVPLFGMGGQDAGLPAGTPVLCDAAQAIGWGWGRPRGTLVCLSLYPTKTVGCAGDGGAILGDDEDLLRATRALANHGLAGAHEHRTLGRNSRLDAVQAPVVCAQLSSLSQRIARRRQIARHYEACLDAPIPRDDRDAVHHFVLRHPSRDDFAARLRTQGVASTCYYPRTMAQQEALPEALRAQLPVAESWARELLAVPCHAELSDDQVARIGRLLEAG